MSAPLTIEYATPVAIAPPARWLLRWGLALSAVAGGVGVFILAAYMALESSWLLGAGMVWLGVGGALAFVAFIFGAVYAITAFARRFPAPATRWRAAIAMVAPLATIPLAIGCVAGGIGWAERVASTVRIVNHGADTIEAAEIIDDTGASSLGPLPPGATRRFILHASNGSISVTLKRAGETSTYDIEQYFHVFPGSDPRSVTVEADGQVTYRHSYGSRPKTLEPTTGPASAPDDAPATTQASI